VVSVKKTKTDGCHVEHNMMRNQH